MKNEAEFCTVIKHSLTTSYKICDDPNGFGSRRCFDGIGMLSINDKLTFVCWEAKFLKTYSAFNFNRIEEHQNFYLTEYQKSGVKSFVIVGINCGRADIRVFVFDWNEQFSELYKNGFSLHKKDLDKLPYNKVSKGAFRFDNIITYAQMQALLQ